MAGVNECFSIGSVVMCTNCFDEEIEGEVLGFEPTTKMLILSILFFCRREYAIDVCWTLNTHFELGCPYVSRYANAFYVRFLQCLFCIQQHCYATYTYCEGSYDGHYFNHNSNCVKSVGPFVLSFWYVLCMYLPLFVALKIVKLHDKKLFFSFSLRLAYVVVINSYLNANTFMSYFIVGVGINIIFSYLRSSSNLKRW